MLDSDAGQYVTPVLDVASHDGLGDREPALPKAGDLFSEPPGALHWLDGEVA